MVLTGGEPAGVAPEITLAAWAALKSDPDCCFVLLGDAQYWRLRNPGAAIQEITSLEEAAGCFSTALPVLQRPLARHPEAGVIDPATAPQVIAAIEEAVDLAFRGEVSAIVTNPIQKEALYQAGFRHQGHTDFLAHLSALHGCEVDEVMMLVAEDLRAIPVTVHIPLKDVPAALTEARIMAQARATARDLTRYFGIESPRLAFTGLNPHAGENGAMGREEIDTIIPALAQLKAEGRVAAIGLGVNEWEVLMEAFALGDWDVFLLAGRYTLLEQTALSPFLETCLKRNASIICGGPFNGGALMGTGMWNYAKAPEAVLQRIKALEAVCAEFGIPLGAAALQFPLAHPAVCTILPGPRTPAELDGILGWWQVAIPAQFWNALADRRLVAPGTPLPNGRTA